jgi:hypothetical protein
VRKSLDVSLRPSHFWFWFWVLATCGIFYLLYVMCNCCCRKNINMDKAKLVVRWTLWSRLQVGASEPLAESDLKHAAHRDAPNRCISELLPVHAYVRLRRLVCAVAHGS